MAFDILQGVQYDPRQDDRSTQLLLSGLAEGNKQYESVRSGLEEALGQYGSEASLYARDPDKPYLQQKLQEITTNLPKLVQDKYAGDYGAARFDIARQLAKEKQVFDLAKAAHAEEQKYAPIYTKLATEKKLINPGGIDPRQQSIFDESGKYVGAPQYNPLERSDYDKIIQQGLVQGIDKLTKEGKLHQSQVPGFMETITRRGLDAIPEGELKNRIKDYTKQFLSESTFMEDPEMAPYKDDPTRFLASRVKALAGAGTSTQYQDDWLMREQMREARGRETSSPKLIRLFSTSVMGNREDVTSVPLNDTTFKGQLKRDLLASKWRDKEGSTDPTSFLKELNEYKQPQTDGTVTLNEFVVKDPFGNIDVDNTLKNIEKFSKTSAVITGDPLYVKADPKFTAKLDLAKKFVKKSNQYVDEKSKSLFGDYGVDVMGFDLTDQNSAKTYGQMNDYISQISPDVFNFETGKFANIKTKKLSKNDDFLKARQDNKFKIQGVIKGADGDIKYIAEDGSGEPQVISSNSDVVNKNLLRMFGSSDLIANFEYKNFKLSPLGNTVVYKDPNSGEEQRVKLKDGYKVERLPDGKYHLKNAQGNVFKENGQPREFDKWEIIHNIGVEEGK